MQAHGAIDSGYAQCDLTGLARDRLDTTWVYKAGGSLRLGVVHWVLVVCFPAPLVILGSCKPAVRHSRSLFAPWSGARWRAR